MITPDEYGLMWDAHSRAVELRRRVEAGLGDGPCVPPKPPEQRVHVGAPLRGIEAETRVCTMGPWAESVYISREQIIRGRGGDMIAYHVTKIFRRLSEVNAVIREDRDF